MEPSTHFLLLFSDDEREADAVTQALKNGGIPGKCVVWEQPWFDSQRGYWVPPRVFWKNITIPNPRTGDDQVYRVFWCRGKWVRNNIDIGFIVGGHNEVYGWIEEDVIYIEKSVEWDLQDEEADLTHESTENPLMKWIVGIFYEEAHGRAQMKERTDAREPYREVEGIDNSGSGNVESDK